MSNDDCARWRNVQTPGLFLSITECQRRHKTTTCSACIDYPKEWDDPKSTNWNVET